MDKKKLQEIQKHLPDHVTLIAVSKTHTKEEIDEAYACGCRVFGENKVQELKEKYDDRYQWHMIGHLQRNKVKYIVGNVTMIHSVDSLRLAEEISKESVKKDVCTEILIEVNVAGEENKFGFTPENVFPELEKMAALPNIKIRVVMTSAPLSKILKKIVNILDN